MALAFVQAVGANGSANANTQAVTVSATGTGNLLIACVFDFNPGDIRTVSGVSDGTNAFTHAVGASLSGNNGLTDVWFLPVSTAGKTTVTATFSGAAGTFFKEIFCIEISGFTNPVLDLLATNAIATGANPQSGPSITTTAAITANIGFCVCGQVTINPNTGNDFTAGGTIVGGDAVCTKLAVATGTQTPQWGGISIPATPFWLTTAAFKETPAGGRALFRQNQMDGISRGGSFFGNPIG